jgi:hypothetical protein
LLFGFNSICLQVILFDHKHLWWKKNREQFPHIAVVAHQYLSIPATTLSSEQVFSGANKVVTKAWAKLSPEAVEMHTLLFMNNKYSHFRNTK